MGVLGALGASGGCVAPRAAPVSDREKQLTLFLCGDVMTGRGIDQVLPHPNDPAIPEGFVKDARHYVDIAEQANGPIPKPVDFDYIWGDGLAVLDDLAPDARIVNLETSITTSDASSGISTAEPSANVSSSTL